jgi:AcrR family transcriptional regulator
MTSRDIEDAVALPPRGTRPRNRRELILQAASRLFYEHGYAQVSIGDIADAVNVAPSALYRHFSGKSGLLYEVVAEVAAVFREALEKTVDADLADTVQLLVSTALDHRQVGVLWQRESRNLQAADRRALGHELTSSVRQLGDKLHRARPTLRADQAELLAASAIGSMLSISFHRLDLPRDEFRSLLAEVAGRILRFEPTISNEAPTGPATSDVSLPRREELLSSAMRLFANNGFTAVSIDDIGAAAGIAGPSVYKHFASKQDLLMAALDRARSQLVVSVTAAQTSTDDNEMRLRNITNVYVRMGLDHSDEIAAMITESRHLKPEDMLASRRAQRAFVDDWAEQLRKVRPTETPVSARIKVQAAQMVANDLGRTPRLRNVAGFRQTVHDLCWMIQA